MFKIYSNYSLKSPNFLETGIFRSRQLRSVSLISGPSHNTFSYFTSSPTDYFWIAFKKKVINKFIKKLNSIKMNKWEMQSFRYQRQDKDNII